MTPPAPGAADLDALAEKYRALVALRGRRDGGDDLPPREALRALAEGHPGCLRELDTLGAAELARRADAAQAAAEGGPQEPWMAWVWSYHALMRGALALKRRCGRSVPSGVELPALLEEATRAAGLPVDEAFLRAVLRPPQRRLGPVVLDRLSQLFGLPARTIAKTLFPVRRPSPYTLR